MDLAFPETEEVSETPDTKPGPPVGQPIMSGHCSTPSTLDPFQSHERCARNGSGSAANPGKVWHPCPCTCHLGDLYECGNCGRLIAEAPLWDGTGEMVYVHLDGDPEEDPTARAVGEDCG